MRNIYDENTIAHNEVNLIIEHIYIGESHSQTMNWMKSYDGCFSSKIFFFNLHSLQHPRVECEWSATRLLWPLWNVPSIISDLVLQADNRKFVWNELKEFDTFPKCGSDVKTTTETFFKTRAKLKEVRCYLYDLYCYMYNVTIYSLLL